MRSLPLFLLVVAALSGCAQKGGSNGATDDDAAATADQLHGYVFDPAFAPLAGATVRVLENNATSVTNEEGFYTFSGLPTEQFIVLVASLDGYEAESRQITIPEDLQVRLNITLTAVPPVLPRMDILSNQDMFLACQATVAISEENQTYDCSGGQGQRDQWDFAVEPDLAGAVIEVFWEPVTTAAES